MRHYNEIVDRINDTIGSNVSYHFGPATKQVVQETVTRLFKDGYGVEIDPRDPAQIYINLFPELPLRTQVKKLVNKHLEGVGK